jgi:hypothetical protein
MMVVRAVLLLWSEGETKKTLELRSSPLYSRATSCSEPQTSPDRSLGFWTLLIVLCSCIGYLSVCAAVLSVAGDLLVGWPGTRFSSPWTDACSSTMLSATWWHFVAGRVLMCCCSLVWWMLAYPFHALTGWFLHAGGLNDGFVCRKYVPLIQQASAPHWSMVQVQLGSFFRGTELPLVHALTADGC